MGYVESVFPSVYQSKRWLGRLGAELAVHHRYMVLLMPTTEESMEKKRLLTGMQLLTVQTMLMFLLAVACDLQVRILLIYFLCQFSFIPILIYLINQSTYLFYFNSFLWMMVLVNIIKQFLNVLKGNH